MSRGAREPSGTVAPGFERVRDVFARSLEREEVGASVCVWHRGKVVVDLWGGIRDKRSDAPWTEDTVATVFSCTKGIVALAFAMLEARGELDLDSPIAEHWPEFAAHGKEAISVRSLLNHRSGLIAVDDPITIEMIEQRPAEVAEILARQQPLWEPGTDQGYHAVTYGLLTAELFRRLRGASLGAFIREEISGPLDADFTLGVPETFDAPIATNYPATTGERLFKIVPKLLFHRGTEGRVYRAVVMGRDTARAFANPAELGMRGIGNFNSERVRRLELAWANGVSNARGLCRIYAALAAGGELDGVRLVDEGQIDAIETRQSWAERDRVLCKPVGWSQGFLKEGPTLFSPNLESFGHAGAGGALGWCDRKQQVAIGYVMNKMDHHVRSPRAIRLCNAVYESIASTESSATKVA